jgi:hypothetical protein
MSASGLVIMDYIPSNTYLAAIPLRYDRSRLKTVSVYSLWRFQIAVAEGE